MDKNGRAGWPGAASGGGAVSHRQAAAAVMDTFVDMYTTLRDMRKRQLVHQVLNLAMIVCSALMIWKSLTYSNFL